MEQEIEEVKTVELSESQELLNTLANNYFQETGVHPARLRANIAAINHIMADVTEAVTRWDAGRYWLMTPDGELLVSPDEAMDIGDVVVEADES